METETEFRAAWSVELYDAGLIIRLHEADGAGFHEFEFPGFTVVGSDVTKILKYFEYTVAPIMGMQKGKPVKKYLQDELFPIARQTHIYPVGDDHAKVTAIGVRIRDPRLIDLRITVDEGDFEPYTAEHTYAGSFGIEWAREE